MRFLNRTIARPLPVITAATILGLLVATVLLPTAPLRPAWNTLIVAATTAIVSLTIGVPLAVLIFRTDLPGRRWLPAVFGMMLLVPLYLQAAGWDAAFGRQGWYAYQWSSLDSPWFSGRLAVVLIHVAASIPWTILLVGLGLQWVEPELEELALLEGRPIQVLWHVTLRRAATAIAVAAIWSMVTTASEMTVADMYQVRTYAEEMYVGFALGDSFGAVVIRLIPGLLITIAGVTALCAIMIPWNPHDRVMTIRSRRPIPLGVYRWCARIAVTLVILIIAGLPLASLIYKAGLVVEQSDGMRVRDWTASRFFQILASAPRRYAEEFRGTALLGATTATCVMLISICGAWWARRGGPRAVLLWIVIATAFALPGPLVSLAVVSILNHPTYDWLAYLYDRTILAPVLALIVRTLPLPLLLTWLGFSSIPQEQLEAARMEGASPLGEFLHVALPQRRRLLLGSWLLAALLAAGDLSASILVTPPGFFTLPTRIFGLVHAGVDDQVAALCLFALGTYAIIAGMILFSTRFRLE